MSFAARVLTRIQDQDDVNVTVGAGVDESALCWDNDTTKFLLRDINALLAAATLGLYGATPVARATTASAAATFVQGSGNAVNDASTFDGYTMLQVVKALREIGVLT